MRDNERVGKRMVWDGYEWFAFTKTRATDRGNKGNSEIAYSVRLYSEKLKLLGSVSKRLFSTRNCIAPQIIGFTM